MIKCLHCGKEIKGRGKLISPDGDFVCDDNCHKNFHKEMNRVFSMTDEELENWVLGGNENEKRK